MQHEQIQPRRVRELAHQNQDEYSSALKLADLDWVDLKEAVITEYEFQTNTVEYEEYGLRNLFHITLLRNDRHEDIILAVDKELMPVLFQYGVTNKTEGTDKHIKSVLNVGFDELPIEIYDYLAQIDATLGSQKSYRSLTHCQVKNSFLLLFHTRNLVDVL